MDTLLLKWGAIGVALLLSGFYIDYRARSQVHEEYRVEKLEATSSALTKAQEDFDARAKVDNENFQLIVALQSSMRRALASQQRMRQSLDAFGVSCDSTSSPGCEAARDIGELLGACVQRYRGLGDTASENYLKAKKAEGLYEVNVTNP